MVRVVIEARVVEVRGAQADLISHSDVTCSFTPTTITISKGMVWYGMAMYYSYTYIISRVDVVSYK